MYIHLISSTLKDLNKDKISDADRLQREASHKDTGKQAEIAFRLYDKDKDGFITKVFEYFIFIRYSYYMILLLDIKLSSLK